MSDIQLYSEKCAKRDKAFARDFEAGYTEFKIGAILRQARERAGLTQEEVACRLHTSKSDITRIENHADDMQLFTLRRYAESVGANLQIDLAQD